MPSPFKIPYSMGTGNILRPFLMMMVTGPNGQSMRIRGIVDSGADSASIPEALASRLGYGPNNLAEIDYGTAGGELKAMRATVPCESVIPQIPGMIVTIYPTFAKVPFALWGQFDFMARFNVEFRKSEEYFTLTPLEDEM